MLGEDQLSDTRPESSKEWKIIEKTMLQLSAEQRRSRRWGVFFKLLTFTYLFALLYLFNVSGDGASVTKGGAHTALIDVNGVIAANEDAAADVVVQGLRGAFEDKNTKGIILRINSPGGSPVQSGYIYDEIKRLKALNSDVMVYAVIGDIGASGAYYIAAAADHIYADKASLVGSIGVTAAGFGFVETLDKLGIERRNYTSGAHKGFLDPFSPEKEEEVEFWGKVLKTTHNQFIGKVKEGRGERLKDNPDLFTGLVWSGEQALELGLIDGLGSPGYVAREVIGVENIVDFTPKPDPFEKFTQRLGTSIGSAISNSVVNGVMKLQ
ncbi:S49 family peptidase [Alkalimarinus coralli]|uniref:S49 family peptidase n=1 Tax=Alkalimarinus coralli TaxID=2935863 RepID=UPI00202AC367|nr:S49 family peptidase [Alkalimarinus coralli]